jgi:serine/threonine protein phosphatase PrpC
MAVSYFSSIRSLLQWIVLLLANYLALSFAPLHGSQSRVKPLRVVDIGVCTIAGKDFQRPKKVNQDASFQMEFEDGHICVGVLDGHGSQGHGLTKFLANELPIEIHGQLREPRSILEWEEQIKRLGGFNLADEDSSSRHFLTLVNGFHAVHWKALNDSDIKAGRSGSTCIACLMKGDAIEVAYVGDSMAILVSLDGTVTPLSEATTVDMPLERQRIEQGEGAIIGSNVFYGPVGIAMTRALGDAVMLRAGVVPTPFVKSFVRKEGDVIVLATDGVSDVLTHQAVAKLVLATKDVDVASRNIAMAAKQKWIGDLPIVDEVKMDDITCMIIR